jgi:hypothetical protein
MTVQDPLRHTSGLTCGIFSDSLVKKAYLDAGVGSGDLTTAEFAEKLVNMPLHNQPGSTRDYSYSTDVLGRHRRHLFLGRPQDQPVRGVHMMQSPKQRVTYRSVMRKMVYAAVEK